MPQWAKVLSCKGLGDLGGLPRLSSNGATWKSRLKHLDMEREMEAIRVQQVIAEDGKVLITGLPYKKGQCMEIVLLPQPLKTVLRSRLTVRQLRESGLIGLWKDRDDIGDSVAYARRLREQAQQRGDTHYDLAG